MSAKTKEKGRRTSGYWFPFNKWWRSHLEKHGERPKAEDMKKWYKDEVKRAFPHDTPTYAMVRNHAKGLRDVASVKEYFREYRARKRRAQAYLEEETEDETKANNGSDDEEEEQQPEAQPAAAGGEADLTVTIRVERKGKRPKAEAGSAAAIMETQPAPGGQFTESSSGASSAGHHDARQQQLHLQQLHQQQANAGKAAVPRKVSSSSATASCTGPAGPGGAGAGAAPAAPGPSAPNFGRNSTGAPPITSGAMMLPMSLTATAPSSKQQEDSVLDARLTRLPPAPPLDLNSTGAASSQPSAPLCTPMPFSRLSGHTVSTGMTLPLRPSLTNANSLTMVISNRPTSNSGMAVSGAGTAAGGAEGVTLRSGSAGSGSGGGASPSPSNTLGAPGWTPFAFLHSDPLASAPSLTMAPSMIGPTPSGQGPMPSALNGSHVGPCPSLRGSCNPMPSSTALPRHSTQQAASQPSLTPAPPSLALGASGPPPITTGFSMLQRDQRDGGSATPQHNSMGGATAEGSARPPQAGTSGTQLTPAAAEALQRHHASQGSRPVSGSLGHASSLGSPREDLHFFRPLDGGDAAQGSGCEPHPYAGKPWPGPRPLGPPLHRRPPMPWFHGPPLHKGMRPPPPGWHPGMAPPPWFRGMPHHPCHPPHGAAPPAGGAYLPGSPHAHGHGPVLVMNESSRREAAALLAEDPWYEDTLPPQFRHDFVPHSVGPPPQQYGAAPAAGSHHQSSARAPGSVPS